MMMANARPAWAGVRAQSGGFSLIELLVVLNRDPEAVDGGR
jgi:type II secretory pathway pseudopilin PulG